MAPNDGLCCPITLYFKASYLQLLCVARNRQRTTPPRTEEQVLLSWLGEMGTRSSTDGGRSGWWRRMKSRKKCDGGWGKVMWLRLEGSRSSQGRWKKMRSLRAGGGLVENGNECCQRRGSVAAGTERPIVTLVTTLSVAFRLFSLELGHLKMYHLLLFINQMINRLIEVVIDWLVINISISLDLKETSCWLTL